MSAGIHAPVLERPDEGLKRGRGKYRGKAAETQRETTVEVYFFLRRVTSRSPAADEGTSGINWLGPATRADRASRSYERSALREQSVLLIGRLPHAARDAHRDPK